MNILYGLATADEGEIVVDGEVRTFDGPGDAIAAGIGMVHQHFMLVPVFTVAENIVLGVEPTGGLGRFRRRKAEQAVAELAERHGLPVDPAAVVETLPVGIQQRVEILKALHREAELLILDEPTAVLTPQETTGPVPGHARAARGRPLAGLHHPQAGGGPRGRRPDHGDARRRGGRLHHPGRDQPGRARHDDGRPRRRPGRGPSPQHPRRRGAGHRRPDASPTAAAASPSRTSTSQIRAGEILAIAGRAGQRPVRARRGAQRRRRGARRQHHPRGRGAGRPRPQGHPAGRRRARAGGPVRRGHGRRVQRRREPRPQQLGRRALRPQRTDRARRGPRARRRAGPRVRRAHPVGADPDGRRCPAATSRRSWSPASSPAT